MNPVGPLRLRAEALRRIRAFFAARAVTEVQTPVITRHGVTDVHVESLGLDDGRFLRTSPEYAHKRLLAAGCGDLYEIGPVFRAGEHGRQHREEFTMLEWYRIGWRWDRLAAEVVELIRALAGLAGADPDPAGFPVHRIGWRDLARSALGFDPLTDPDALERGLTGAPAAMDRPEQLDWLFSLHMQPALQPRAITIVHDFPACQAALARIRDSEPPVAERFEVFIGRIELANGYQELTNPVEQRDRFEQDNRRRAALGLPTRPIDESLLEALDRGLPECAGVALGFDRLLMILAGSDDLGAIASL